jgi:hypothetical protein
VEIVKAPPPAGKGGNPRIDWGEVADRLRANPGQWGVIHDVSRAMGTAIKNGRVAALRPPHEWETMTRRDPALSKTRGTLYVRYIGGR